MPLYLFYTMVQKSQKWPKTQIKGGPALTFVFKVKGNTTTIASPAKSFKHIISVLKIIANFDGIPQTYVKGKAKRNPMMDTLTSYFLVLVSPLF